MELGIEARTPHQPREHLVRIGAVTPHFAAKNSRKPCSGMNCAHDQHVPAVSVAKRGIIGPNHVGELPHQGITPLGPAPRYLFPQCLTRLYDETPQAQRT